MKNPATPLLSLDGQSPALNAVAGPHEGMTYETQPLGGGAALVIFT